MSELNHRLNSLEYAITHQRGARKAFSELKKYLLTLPEQPAFVDPVDTTDDDVEEIEATTDVQEVLTEDAVEDNTGTICEPSANAE